jgi:hypothetical protein
MRPQPLLDVLGGGWSLGVAVVAADWDADLAGFALRDGSVVLARAEWEGVRFLRHVRPAASNCGRASRRRLWRGKRPGRMAA